MILNIKADKLVLHVPKYVHATNQCAHRWACAQVGRQHRPAPSLGTPCMPRRAHDNITDPCACVQDHAHTKDHTRA